MQKIIYYPQHFQPPHWGENCAPLQLVVRDFWRNLLYKKPIEIALEPAVAATAATAATAAAARIQQYVNVT
jgi:hypothetical protein